MSEFRLRIVDWNFSKANKTKTVELQALRTEHADALAEQGSQLKKANEKNEELEKQLKTVNEKHNELGKQLKKANEKSEELENQLEDATSEAEKLRQEVTEVRNGKFNTQRVITDRLFLDKVNPEGCRGGQGCRPIRT